MMSKHRLQLFYSILTFIFVILALLNLFDLLYFHPLVKEGAFWRLNEKTNQLVIEKIIPNGAAEKAGLVVGDTLVAINNKPFSNEKEAWHYIARFKPNEQLTYSIKRKEKSFQVTIVLEKNTEDSPFFIISTIVGLTFILVGYIVVIKKPYMKIPRLFYYFCSTFFIIIGLNAITKTPVLKEILLVISIVGYALWAPSILHFFMNFPLKVPLLHKHPKIIYPLYLPSILAVVYFLLFEQKHRIVLTLVLSAYIFLAIHYLFCSKRKITNPHEKKSLRVISLGMIIGLIPLGILSFSADWIIAQLGMLPVSIVFCFTTLVPITFGYAIMRYGLMDVEIIIRKSLLYSLITTSFILLYFIIVIGLGGFAVRQFGISSEAANLIFLIIAALAFQPIRNGIQTIIDRRFYRDRYQYQKTLLRLSQELPGLVNIQEILKRISQTISNAMHVSNVMIHMYDHDTDCYKNHFSIGIDPQNEYTWQEEPNGLLDIMKKEKNCCLFYKIEEDDRYHNLPVADKVKIEKLNIVLSVPMFYQDSLIGMISLGPKQSAQVYNQEDMDLLQTLAGNSAIALVNARLHQEDIRKQRFENELILARHIQNRLLPEKDPTFPDVQIVGFSKPATIVGGDYYDYLPLTKNQFYIFVGDVSGKGMPAALYMSKVQGMIQIAAEIHKSPRQLFIDINKQLYYRMERKYFITMLGVLVDSKEKRLAVCRAGHMPIYIKRFDKIEKITSDGIALGLDAGKRFTKKLKEKEITLKKGDYCLFFSDGLVELMNPGKQFFGEKRLESIMQNSEFNSAQELKDIIIENINDFQQGAQQHDDITFVVLHVT